MDVLTCAWQAAGSPQPDSCAREPSRCARCDLREGATAVRNGVSKQFTGFDTWTNPTGKLLCEVCLWGFQTTSLRENAYVVHRPRGSGPTSTPQQRGQIAAILVAGALDRNTAITVPLRPRRKHLVPDATWRQVTTDEAHLSWGEREATLLQTCGWLRSLGFGSRMLREPAPPFAVLRKLARTDWATVTDAWSRLEIWRGFDNPWMNLAVHITTPQEKK